jgi:isopentenyl-diphosphate delta-isomerase
MGKMQAHREGLMHRAISVFIFDSKKRLLLQRRALEKYHSAGQWANSCCGHPRPFEAASRAAKRRVFEELGASVRLTYLLTLTYQAITNEGLFENERVDVFYAFYDGPFDPNPDEVMEVRWSSLDEAVKIALADPEQYAPWFRYYCASISERLLIISNDAPPI